MKLVAHNREMAMKNNREESSKEVEKFIKTKLKENGIYPELLRVKIEDVSKVILQGEVESWETKYVVYQIVSDMLDSYDVIDEMDVFEGAYGCFDDNEDEMLDEDRESVGTEDVFRSVEEGMPYIPPSIPSYRIFYGKVKKKPAGD